MNTSLLIWNLARSLYGSVVTVLFYAWFGYLRRRCPFKPGRVAIGVCINFSIHCIVRLFLRLQFASYMLTGAGLIAMTKLIWPSLKGSRYWFTFFFAFILAVLTEFAATLLYAVVYPHPEIQSALFGREITLFRPESYPALCLLTVSIMLGPLAIAQLVQNAKRKPKAIRHTWAYLMRFSLVLLLVFTVMILYGRDFDAQLFLSVESLEASETLKRNLPLNIVYGFTVALLMFYGWQDIQQYRLRRRNQTLIDQNAAYQRVIDSTREFRHNIANMIYGLEGVILTGDVAQIEEYYSEMAKRCALINNENAVALNRLNDAALTALILRKLGDAQERAIPFFLTVDSGFAFTGLATHTLCEVMGNLLDNAIEAAGKSESPQVELTLRSTDAYDEILLSNTYSENADLSFLTGEAISSKPGHRATGLASAKRLVKRNSNVCLNQYRQSRFIETSLCEYRS